MTVLDRMKDLLTRLENNDPALDSEILKIYSEKVKTRQQNELNSKSVFILSTETHSTYNANILNESIEKNADILNESIEKNVDISNKEFSNLISESVNENQSTHDLYMAA
ncbi:hypothetical protein ACVRWF_05620 [Streptococcus uberis]